MSKITVNGVSYDVPKGASISIVNNNVLIGNSLAVGGLSGIVELKIEGDVGHLRTDASVTVNGNVKGDVGAGGSVTVKGDVRGNVDAGGSVTCGNVGGDVDAGGSVTMKKRLF